MANGEWHIANGDGPGSWIIAQLCKRTFFTIGNEICREDGKDGKKACMEACTNALLITDRFPLRTLRSFALFAILKK